MPKKLPYLLLLLSLLPACTPPTDARAGDELRVQGRELLDTRGAPLLLRGINLQYGDAPDERWPAIARIAGTGANAVRLQLRAHTTADQLRAALDAIVGAGMVAIPMVYGEDITCGDAAAALQRATALWQGDWRAVLQAPRYRGRLILNLANEWGLSDTAEQRAHYLDHYRSAIAALRAAGYRQPLMIDAPHCGQDALALADGLGAALRDADPLQQVLLSVHAYWRFADAAQLRAATTALHAAGLAFVWGEFGNRQFQAAQDRATDHRALMRQANRAQVGYLAWSWYGNGGEARALDLAQAANSDRLTGYGEEVIEGSWLQGWPVRGLRATARRPGSPAP